MTKAMHPFAGGRKTTTVTRKHRMLIRECLLGTVDAFNPITGEEKYFDYDWDGARAFALVDRCADLRVCAPSHGPTFITSGGGRRRNHGKIALYGVPPVREIL